MRTKTDPRWDAALRQAYEKIALESEVSADTIAETDLYREQLYCEVMHSDPSIGWSKDQMAHRLTILRRKKYGLRPLKDILAAKQQQVMATA